MAEGFTQQSFWFVSEPQRPEESHYEYEHVSDLESLWEIARGCTKCGLRKGCKQVVFGDGRLDADIVFVGEAPGAEEDEQGKPFVGPAGQLLDRILDAAGFARQDVYITNVVMCRPPFNRLPNPQEVEACRPFLRSKLRILSPKIVVCLGALATQCLIDPRARITMVRGKLTWKDGVLFIPTYHPAALLRDPSKKKETWEDFKLIRDEYLRLKRGESAGK